MELRGVAAAVALLTSLLLTLASFYWAVSGGGVVAVATFLAFAVIFIALIALSPWSSEGAGPGTGP